MSDPKFREGERVVCRKAGPFDGKRGNVRDVWQGQALVDFQQSTIIEPVTSFESVNP